MFRTTLATVVCTVFVAALSSSAAAQHLDIQLQIIDDQLNTGQVNLDDPETPVIPDVRVFPRTMDTTPIPHRSTSPGFNAFAGTFPEFTQIGFNVLDALRKWDGEDFDTIPVETLRILEGGAEVVTPDMPDEFVSGFFFAQAGSGGGIHEHVTFFLNPPQSAGVYLLTMELKTNSGSIGTSDPIWILFNDGDTPEALDDATQYVIDNLLAPEPCPGDVNGDQVVDISDLNLVLGNFGTAGPSGDLNEDSVVDIQDLNLVLGNFSQSCGD